MENYFNSNKADFLQKGPKKLKSNLILAAINFKIVDFLKKNAMDIVGGDCQKLPKLNE